MLVRSCLHVLGSARVYVRACVCAYLNVLVGGAPVFVNPCVYVLVGSARVCVLACGACQRACLSMFVVSERVCACVCKCSQKTQLSGYLYYKLI